MDKNQSDLTKMSNKKEKEKKERKKYKLEDDGGDDDEVEGREIKMTFTKKSKKINRPVTFTDEPTEVNVAIESLTDYNSEMFIQKAPLSKVTQKAPVISRSDCNSEMIKFTEKGLNHLEGGWPKEVDITEQDQVGRFLKKIEKDDRPGDRPGTFFCDDQ